MSEFCSIETLKNQIFIVAGKELNDLSLIK